MSASLVSLLDFPTAWQRVKDDLLRRNFVRHPYETQLIDSALSEWLESVREAIATGRYSPSSPYMCEVPKPKGGIRPAALLSAIDRVVYAACVGACFPEIHAAIEWAQKTTDFSYRLAPRPTDLKWVQNQFLGWRKFSDHSLKLAQGTQFVLFTDIAGFYENIDLGILASDVRACGGDKSVVDLLGSVLNRWAQVPNRSIPQGITASDILAKVYLNTVDENLATSNINHVRYVDDIRVFCNSELEAKKALILLTRFLRWRGLSLQAAKTVILRQDEAIEKIEGVMPAVRRIASRYLEEIRAEADDPYLSVPEADEFLESNPDNAPLELLEIGFRENFEDPDAPAFNPTLFHFLLRRLGQQKSEVATETCLQFIVTRPEETGEIVKYFSSFDNSAALELRLLDYLQSEQAIYPYQVYQVLGWIAEKTEQPTWEMVQFARKLALDTSQPKYLHAVCRKIVGDHGSNADLEMLLASYHEIADPLEQVEVMCSLRRMEKSKRNSFLARAESDSNFTRIAARFVRTAR